MRGTSISLWLTRLALSTLVLGWIGCGDETGLEDHVHDADDITTGTLDNERLNTGSGNGLDADQLDGLDASDLAMADHTHDGVDADLLDGQDSTAFASANHTHLPVLWVGGSRSLPGCDGTPLAYGLNEVSVDTSDGHFAIDPAGTITINTPGLYRIRAWSMVHCSSVMAHPCTFSQTLLRNGDRVEGSAALSPIPEPTIQAHFEAKLDSTYIGSFTAGDTFGVEYRGEQQESVMGNHCNAFSPSTEGDSGVQIQFLGSL